MKSVVLISGAIHSLAASIILIILVVTGEAMEFILSCKLKWSSVLVGIRRAQSVLTHRFSLGDPSQPALTIN